MLVHKFREVDSDSETVLTHKARLLLCLLQRTM